MNEKARLGLVYEFEFIDADGRLVWSERKENLMPQDGVDYAALALFGDVPPISTFYMGLFRANVLPTSALKASDIPGTLQEFTGYSEATRPIWERTYDGIGAISNVAERCEFSITADDTLHGGFLVSESSKGGGTGLLFSVCRFNEPKPVTAGGTFRVGSVLSLIPTNVA